MTIHVNWTAKDLNDSIQIWCQCQRWWLWKFHTSNGKKEIVLRSNDTQLKEYDLKLELILAKNLSKLYKKTLYLLLL